MIGKSIDQLTVGDTDQFSKTISESDIYMFAGITGDLNPAHVNEEYAKNTFFKGRIAHGLLIGGLISTVMGTRLPGPGTIYLKQTLNFLAPVRINDTITAKVEVTEIIKEKNKAVLKTTCVNQKDVEVVSVLVLRSIARNSPLKP